MCVKIVIYSKHIQGSFVFHNIFMNNDILNYVRRGKNVQIYGEEKCD